MTVKQTNVAEKIKLPRTDLEVTRLCFGLAPLGSMPETYGYGVSDEDAAATLQAIFNSPTNFIDTSRNYGLGRSEERVGFAIRSQGSFPKGLAISTKLDRDFVTNKFDAAQTRRSFEESLKALGVDRVQLLHVHDPEWAASLDDINGANGAIAELFRIKEEGLADAVGLAAGRTDIMIPMLKEWDFDALITHNRFTLVNRHAEAMIDLAVERKIAVLNAAPYASGILAKGAAQQPRYAYQEASPEMLKHVERIAQICTRNGIPMGAAALQFSMRDPRIASTIVGVSKPERIAQTVAWANHPISDDVWEELLALPYETEDPEAKREYTLG
jgi:D-threo-aldose 1-dehydrogenase